MFSRGTIDNSRSIHDHSRSIIDQSRSIIDHSKSIIANCKRCSKIVASLTVDSRGVIYNRNNFIIQAIARIPNVIPTYLKTPL